MYYKRKKIERDKFILQKTGYSAQLLVTCAVYLTDYDYYVFLHATIFVNKFKNTFLTTNNKKCFNREKLFLLRSILDPFFFIIIIY